MRPDRRRLRTACMTSKFSLPTLSILWLPCDDVHSLRLLVNEDHTKLTKRHNHRQAEEVIPTYLFRTEVIEAHCSCRAGYEWTPLPYPYIGSLLGVV